MSATMNRCFVSMMGLTLLLSGCNPEDGSNEGPYDSYKADSASPPLNGCAAPGVAPMPANATTR